MATGRGRAGLLVFAVALFLRLAFWLATPDAAWPGSAHYLGDAALWVDYATAIMEERGHAFELGLPLRPPANAWLLAPWLAAGGLAAAKLVWCLLGALTCWLAYRAAAAAFGPGPGLATGLLCAGSTALLALSTSLNNETPYLVVALATLALGEHLRRRSPGTPGTAAFAVWGALGALGCLLRAEHALVVALLAAWLGWVVLRPRAGEGGLQALRRPVAALLAGLVLPLLLWHAAAWTAVHRFNQQEPGPGDGDRYLVHRSQGQILDRLGGQTRWTPAARAERARWPAFARRTATLFVDLTALHRAARRGTAPPVEITAEDLEILDQAFGTRPEPLPAHPFIALYGGLNFHLANHGDSDGGFSRGPLAARPPLTGGAAAYPRWLIAGLPPDELVLTYPPHLAEVNHGWRYGACWIADHPGRAAGLVREKLRRFWAGASLGLTGYGLPLGTSGVRWPVDLAVPRSLADGPPGGGGDENGGRGRRAWVSAWRWALLVVAVCGAIVGRPRSALAPWLLFLAAKALTAAAFFGYARLGATVVPVVALLVSLAAARVLAPRLARRTSTGPPRRLLLAAVLLLVAVETARWLDPPVLRLDGHTVTTQGPYPADDPEPRRLEVAR